MVAARALGLAERGRQVVAETEAAIRSTRDANPGLAGRSFTFSFAFAPGQIVTLKSDRDSSVKLPEGTGNAAPFIRRAVTGHCSR